MITLGLPLANADLTGILILLLGVGLGAAIGYAIGKPKGLEQLGLILGPLGLIGWIILMVMKPAPHMQRGQRYRSGARSPSSRRRVPAVEEIDDDRPQRGTAPVPRRRRR